MARIFGKDSKDDAEIKRDVGLDMVENSRAIIIIEGKQFVQQWLKCLLMPIGIV